MGNIWLIGVAGAFVLPGSLASPVRSSSRQEVEEYIYVFCPVWWLRAAGASALLIVRLLVESSENLADAGLADVQVAGEFSLILELAAVEKGLIMTSEGEGGAFGLWLVRRAGEDGLNGGPGVERDPLGPSP